MISSSRWRQLIQGRVPGPPQLLSAPFDDSHAQVWTPPRRARMSRQTSPLHGIFRPLARGGDLTDRQAVMDQHGRVSVRRPFDVDEISQRELEVMHSIDECQVSASLGQCGYVVLLEELVTGRRVDPCTGRCRVCQLGLGVDADALGARKCKGERSPVVDTIST